MNITPHHTLLYYSYLGTKTRIVPKPTALNKRVHQYTPYYYEKHHMYIHFKQINKKQTQNKLYLLMKTNHHLTLISLSSMKTADLLYSTILLLLEFLIARLLVNILEFLYAKVNPTKTYQNQNQNQNFLSYIISTPPNHITFFITIIK